jgi:predicted transposase YbfD/YdcC
MEQQLLAPITEFFSVIEDPRIERKKKYPLIEVIIITLLAVMAFAQGWEDIERFGIAKKVWLSKFLKLENGIPKHDVYRRVFCMLKPKAVEQCFMNWVRAVKNNYDREVIAIDGKTVRGSFNAQTGSKAIHLVSAWATENKLVFGQVKTEDHSNEITAIPSLLDMLALEGCIVTIDAMGCQYNIANKIVNAKADYLFSLKGNQGTLHEDVKEYLDEVDFNHLENISPAMCINTVKTHDVDHGRIEHRYCAATGNVEWLIERHPEWKTIQSIGMVESMRNIDGKETTEKRYFISSLPPDVNQLEKTVRAHWGIENSLHYILDVAMKEDACRIKAGNSPENMAYIRKIALTIARSDKESKSSMAGRIKQMAWSDEYLEKLLFNSDFASKVA